MNINFPPVDDEYIKAKVEAGYYSNATELVRDAVRRLRERERDVDSPEARRQRVLAILRESKADVDAGRHTVFDKNFMKRNLAEVKKLAAAGGPFDPDVVGPEGQEPWA